MTRAAAWAAALVLLVSTASMAQGVPPMSSSSGGGTACGLASSGSAFAASFRATTATNLGPAFLCDALLTHCIKLGPGQDTGVGVNALGEVVFGRTGQSTGTWRFWGAVVSAGNVSGTGLSASGNVTAGSAYLFGANAFLQNATSAKPVLVDDADGFQVKCKTAIGTCTSALESSAIDVCGTGGALTKRCVCMGDGTTYAWRNLFNLAAGAGTTTTCPAT